MAGERSGGLQVIGRRAVIGGAWGAAVAVAVLEPAVLVTHHLAPQTIAQWSMVTAVVAGFGFAIGVVDSIVAGFIVTAWSSLRARSLGDLEWAIVLCGIPLLVPLWFGLSALIHVVLVGTLAAPSTVGATLALVLLAVLIPSTLWTYRHIVTRDQHPSVWVAAWFAGMTLVAMALVPPLRLAPATTAAAFDDAPLIAHRDAPATHAPLLVVGIDSGNWRSLDPLLAAGRLPTLAGLIERGSRGVIEAQWPPYWSSPAWAAMMTGYSIDEHGWHGDLAVDAWGLPPFDAPQERTDLLPIQAAEWFLALHNVIRFVPPARSTLHRPLVWERLRRANVDSGVLRFDFTYPAEGQARYVISNHFGLDTWALALSAPESNPLAATAAARDAGLEAPFRTAFDHAEFATILPTQSRQPPDLHLDPFPVLRVAYKCDRDTLDAAAQLVRSVPTLPVSFVYLGGFDAVCHHFWQYRHPEDYGTNAPAAEDIAALGQVVDRFLEFLDRGLGQVLASYTAPPNVLIVSDHGHGPVFDHPTFRGWHEPHGVFIAAGPDIRHRAEPVPFSYYDVTPTILDLLGYDPPPDLRGWPLRKLLADDPLTTAARSPR